MLHEGFNLVEVCTNITNFHSFFSDYTPQGGKCSYQTFLNENEVRTKQTSLDVIVYEKVEGSTEYPISNALVKIKVTFVDYKKNEEGICAIVNRHTGIWEERTNSGGVAQFLLTKLTFDNVHDHESIIIDVRGDGYNSKRRELVVSIRQDHATTYFELISKNIL